MSGPDISTSRRSPSIHSRAASSGMLELPHDPPSSCQASDPSPDDDEWEEEDDDENSPDSPRPTTHIVGHSIRVRSGVRPRLPRSHRLSPTRVRSSHNNTKPTSSEEAMQSHHEEHAPHSLDRAVVGFANIKETKQESSSRPIVNRPHTASSRSSSPSRLIRFADPARPNRGGSKKPKKKNRLGLLKLVSNHAPKLSSPAASSHRSQDSEQHDIDESVVEGETEQAEEVHRPSLLG